MQKNLTGFHPKPQLACFKENDDLCEKYELSLVTCIRKNINSTNYLDIIDWECSAVISAYVEFDERTIECEPYVDNDNNPAAPELVIKGSCSLSYLLRREPKLTDFDRYLFAKASGYCFFTLMFLIVCCVIAQKNKRAREQRARLVNVYCVTNGDNELVIGYAANSTTNNGIQSTNSRSHETEEDDLPPSYSTLFN